MKSMEYRRYRAAWESNPKFDIVNWVPLHLDLETTARCQLKCPGCPSTKLKFGKGDMPYEHVRNLLRDFAEMGGNSVKFNWRGEPTLYPRLADAVACAREAGLVDIGINTNGVALTPVLSKELVDAGITMVAFSIDSYQEKRYEILRPGANLTKVLLNLRAFLQEAERRDDLYVRIQRIDYPDEPISHGCFVDFFKEKFPRVNSVASNRYKEKDDAGCVSRPSKPCAQLWQRMVVTFDGWMGPCCEFNRFGEHRFGRYPDASLSETWRSIELEGLRRYHSCDRQNEIGPCAKCTVTKPAVTEDG
jgi:sulfatase maturation enzyme AslB (radical SAM superfamily)